MTALNDLNALQASVAEAVLGQDEVIRQIIIGLLANGHLLLESLPGLAKTRTVKALARHLDAKMSRVQFTPDLLPSDITGAEVLHQVDGQNVIRFQPGPLFGNLILADEINRAPAKVQAALLEAMEERQITVAGNSHPLPPLFMVLATQNPIEQEGTYPLPEAQVDRFMLKARITYPKKQEERDIIRMNLLEGGCPEPAKVIEPEDIVKARRVVSDVYMDEKIEQYIIDIIFATQHAQYLGLIRRFGVVEHQLHHKAVHLRFRQRVGAFGLDGVLRGHHQEGLGHLVRLARNGHLALLHHLQQRALHLGGRAVDFVRQQQVGKYGA